MIGCVLVVEFGPKRGAYGQTLGANGEGIQAYVLHGDPDAATLKAREIVDRFVESGERLKRITVVSGLDEYMGGPAIRLVS